MKGLTQAELAKLVGIGERYLQTIEYGKAKPNIEIVLRLAYYLEVEVGDLFLLEVGTSTN